MLKGLKITLFALLAVFSVGFLADLQIAEAVEDSITVNVDPALHQLSVIIDGDGFGNVLSISPSAGVINCGIGTSCSTTYNHGTSVTLKASASAGSTFSSWAGCSVVNGNTCTVLMDEAKTVTAIFNLNTHNLTVSKQGTGNGTVSFTPSSTSCGTDCYTYVHGDTVELTASASAGSTFSSWAGCSVVNENTCTVLMDEAKTVTATFDLNTYIAPPMEGIITANPNPCQIAEGQSTCNTTLTWSVQNPVSAVTAVTTPGETDDVGTGHEGSTPYTVEHGGRTFYLYNNSIELGQITASANCISGTEWNGSICQATPEEMTGNLSVSPTSCEIPYDQESCSVSVSWNVYNPESSNTAVTISPNGEVFATGHSGSKDHLFTSSNSVTFYLYNNGELLAQAIASATKEPAPPMEGIITANPNPCQIAEGQSTCNTTLTWSVQNPVSAVTAVTTPGETDDVGTGHEGSTPYTVEHGGRTFYLYNNSIELGQITASANCISGTEWNGSICQATPEEMTGNLSVSPTSCEIPYDQESCSVSVSWNVYNPESSNTAVTISPNGEVFATGHSGSKDHLFTSSNSVTFYLYNNGELLAQAIASATKEPAPPMEGIITANPNPCQIAEGQSTCDTTLAWSVQNPISYTEVTTPVGVVVDSSIEDSGDVTYSVEHGGRTFYLYNSEELLDQVTVSPICEGGTSWLGSSCEGPKELIVSKNGAGTVTSDVYGISCGIDCSGVYAHGSRVTLTATVTEADNSMFSSWSAGCDEVNGNTCTVLMDEDKNVTANFMEVWVDAQSSFVEGSSIYNTIPNTIITIPYTTSSSLSPSECRLLDYEKLPLAEYYETDNPITLTSPSSSGSYGYYIQCRNQNNHNIIAVSEEIIVNAVAVSVSLLKSFDTALPSSDYNFAFVPYSSPNVEYLNHVSCRLLDSDKNKLEPQDDTWISVNLNEPNGIYHKLPGGYLGSFGYYIRCRNDVVTIAEADSDKMTITTYCPEGKKLYEGICVAPGISASDCVIETGERSCEAAINWEIPSLDGVWAITANIPVFNTTVVDIVEPNNIGQVSHSLPRVGDFPFFLYNDGFEVGSSRAYARCRPGTVWTSPDGTTGTCEIMQNSIDVTICSIPREKNSCQTEASWALDNIPPEKDINDFRFIYPENKLVSGEGLVGDDRKQTLYDVTLFHGDNHFKIFDGAVLIGERNIIGACVENTEWDTESGTCVIKEPEINYFKAEPETIFKGQSTTLSWNFEGDRVDYCLLEKRLSIDDNVENLSTINSSDSNGSLEDSPLGTTIYYMTCYKEGSEPTDTKEAIVSVIDMVIEEK